MNQHVRELLEQLQTLDEWLRELEKEFSKDDSNVSEEELDQRKREAESWLFSIYSSAYVNMQLVLKQELVESTLNNGLKSLSKCPKKFRDGFKNSLEKTIQVLFFEK